MAMPMVVLLRLEEEEVVPAGEGVSGGERGPLACNEPVGWRVGLSMVCPWEERMVDCGMRCLGFFPG